ncbi:MAG: hypothetical protein M3Q48_13765 [Actinomycetota bacterium]|nr:hypothetical protein [Actinomycetota bacterium]
MPDEVAVGAGLRIPLHELDWRFSASGGPGGQHANTANTRVEVRFDVASSPSLTPWQRAGVSSPPGPAHRQTWASPRLCPAGHVAHRRLNAHALTGHRPLTHLPVVTRPLFG